MTPEEMQAEELKRERAYHPRERWLAIQGAIVFAEANLPPEQRRNRPRWHPDTKFWSAADRAFVGIEPDSRA